MVIEYDSMYVNAEIVDGQSIYGYQNKMDHVIRNIKGCEI